MRPPLPWRPSKLRLEVEAERSPGESLSGFMARHMEQPALRHSAPKSLKTRSRPSASAWRRMRAEAGTTSMRTPGALVRPRTTSAAARRSSMRPLVQLPRKTVSTRMSRSGMPGVRSMYSMARSAARRSVSSAMSPGTGTRAEMGRPWPGLVPQVTKGSMSAASRTTSVSKTASASVRRESQ